jgi:uncharacterized protein (DUF433 family)
MGLSSRITMNPKVMSGRPTIRDIRFTVVQILELFAGGMTVEEILEDYPYIEREDVYACLDYAVRASNTRQVMSFA